MGDNGLTAHGPSSESMAGRCA